MPIFEFQCLKCNKQFEEIVSSSRAQDISCPKCRSRQTRKLISQTCGVRANTAVGKACGSGAPSRFS